MLFFSFTGCQRFLLRQQLLELCLVEFRTSEGFESLNIHLRRDPAVNVLFNGKSDAKDGPEESFLHIFGALKHLFELVTRGEVRLAPVVRRLDGLLSDIFHLRYNSGEHRCVQTIVALNKNLRIVIARIVING
jgi:hypothetical protein